MLGIIILVLAVAGGVVTLLALAMLYDIAFGRGPEVVEAREAAARRWTPPFVTGRDLFHWARSIATTSVEEVLDRGSGPSTATDIVRQLDGGAARAMLPELNERDARRPVACPQEGLGRIGVTPPEAIALAESLRATLEPDELASLTNKVSDYGARIAGGLSPSPCALQGDGCRCVAYGVHPMGCRPRLAEGAAARRGRGGGSDQVLNHASAIGLGVVDGLTLGLEGAGLDGNRYELHSALERALACPDAGTRWADGEPVFAGCNPFREAPRRSASAG